MERHSVFIAWKTYVVKLQILPKAIYGFNAISIKCQHFFAERKKRKPTLKFIYSLKGPQIAKMVLKKEESS